MNIRKTTIRRRAARTLLIVPALFCLSLAGCGRNPDDGPGPEPATWAGSAVADGLLVVTHGGVGSPPELADGCRLAADTGAASLGAGAPALEAAVAAAVALENDPRFNAGTGANIRLDGRTIQMDAALMSGDGRFAAVAVIERVRNPVLVAREVYETPHRLLAGDGATRFAHAMGFADEIPSCPEAEAKHRRRIARLLRGETSIDYRNFDWRKAWNYPAPIPTPADTLPPMAAAPGPETGDTIGAVTRAADGAFAVALSTGGTSITLDGRVGDVPIYGCGCYAGPDGAVACTGFGEQIIRSMMARTVYVLMENGMTAREAVRRGCAMFPEEYSLGLIAVGREGWGVGANRQMAYGKAGAR